MADLAIRTMWWNGGRVARNGDRANGNNPLAYVGIVLLITAPIIAKAMQATISRRTRDARRRQRLPAHPVPARADLGARETEGRHDGDAFRVHRYGTLVDRAAHEWRRRRRQAGRHPPNVRHPPSARRAHRPPERTLMKRIRPAPPSPPFALVAAACGGGGDETPTRRDHVDLLDDHHDRQATTTTSSSTSTTSTTGAADDPSAAHR
jgi:hypothetical protein